MNISVKSHYGIDIIAPKNEPVSILMVLLFAITGHLTTVMLSTYNKKNLISIYKHNSEILKEIGDFVESGEPIAIVGTVVNIQLGHIYILNYGIMDIL